MRLKRLSPSQRQDKLYRAPIDGSSAPVRLDDPPTDYHQLRWGFALSQDGTRVLYRATLIGASADLFSVPVDGSSAPVNLTGSAERVLDYGLTPDGALAVFTTQGYEDIGQPSELYSVPTDASAPPRKLDPVLPPGAQVEALIHVGERVLFLADQMLYQAYRHDHYSVPADGSAPAVRLNGGGQVASALVSPDGSHVVYRADELVLDQFELFNAALDGSSTVHLPGTTGTRWGLQHTPDGRRLLPPVQLHTLANEALFGVAITPDSEQVILWSGTMARVEGMGGAHMRHFVRAVLPRRVPGSRILAACAPPLLPPGPTTVAPRNGGSSGC